MRNRLQQTLSIEVTEPNPQGETDDTHLSDMILAAGEAQDDLRWLNFIKGRQSIKLEEAYNAHLENIPGRKSHRSGRAWGAAVIKESLQLLVDIWYYRNDQYHNKEEGEDTSSETKQIHKRVRETYEDRLAYTPTIQILLYDRTIEERLQQRPSN